MDFRALLYRLIAKHSLSESEAGMVMQAVLEGKLSDAQLGGMLVAIAAKGASGEELAGFARTMTGMGIRLHVPYPVVDTCGTGGGSPSFNISTGAAIVLASCGVKVAKHGNRAVTSACGSADVLEALGVRFSEEPSTALQLLDTVGIAFLFALSYHPALKEIGKVRRELQVRTVFNQLGPLANPAGADSQVIGLFDASLMAPTAEAMVRLGIVKGLAVHGKDGLDEISPCTSTDYIRIENGVMTFGVFTPQDFGIEPLTSDQIAPGSTVPENAALLVRAVQGGDPLSDALVPSASAALWLVRGGSLADSAKEVRAALSSGQAAATLEKLIEVSASL